MSLVSPHGQNKARTGLSRTGQVRHIVDTSAPEFLRRKSDVAFCGTQIVSDSSNNNIPMCQKCVTTVRKLDKEIYKLKSLPNEKEIKLCMELIISESQPKLAEVIYLFPRSR
jgi:hypothetical protein